MHLKKLPVLLLLSIFLGCSSQYDHVPDAQFVGIWELAGRKMFNGVQIKIAREQGQLVGRISRLNDNKYVQLFAEEGGLWVSEINRSSDFQFRIIEKKLGRELFSLYGLSGSTEYKAEFIAKDTIGIATSGDPLLSTIRYIRVRE